MNGSWNVGSVKEFIFDDGELPLFARWSDGKVFWLSGINELQNTLYESVSK